MAKYFLFALLLAAQWASSQDLPNYYSPQELLQLPDLQQSIFENRSANALTLPPALPVRTAAEWEEMQGYLITWTSYPSMLREIVRYGKQECRMYIVTNNASSVISDLQNNGMDTTNITFLNLPYNSVWMRDYGQNSVYYNDVDSLAFVDWIYNRLTRKKDDTIPAGVARHLGLTLYTTTDAPYNLVNTGGNWMTDGLGTAFASKLIFDDNVMSAGFGTNHNEAEIDSIIKKFMGIDRYIKMEKLPYDGIHHIDMHMKLLDEETLLVGEYPAGIADGPQIEANIQYVLSGFQTSFGTPYRIIRIPMPDDNGQWPSGNGDYLTYTNASFINKTIIVPTYNIPEDSTALRIWRESCPGYKVVGINSTSSIPASGALHCITHEIGAAEPLWITHQRLRDTYETQSDYMVTARAYHRAGIDSVALYYTTDTNVAYQRLPMYDVFGDHYEAYIPAKPAGTEVFYYLHAYAKDGKQQVRPITAPEGFYQFKVLGTTAAHTENASPALEIFHPFPNPSKGITCLPVSTSQAQAISIDCVNVLGEQVSLLFEGTQPTGKSQYFMNTEHFSSGVYFIRYKTNGAIYTQRLIVK
ncbi:MAG: agmatine deiminase family protein [Bacteroidetes bacterium]|nr:agmatine deiminase family protein [Bacteroidota bacterium]